MPSRRCTSCVSAMAGYRSKSIERDWINLNQYLSRFHFTQGECLVCTCVWEERLLDGSTCSPATPDCGDPRSIHIVIAPYMTTRSTDITFRLTQQNLIGSSLNIRQKEIPDAVLATDCRKVAGYQIGHLFGSKRKVNPSGRWVKNY